MSKIRKILLVALAIGLAATAYWALSVGSYRPLRSPAGQGASEPALGNPWRGAVHVHSSASDGAGDIDEIMAAAATAGVDFVILTDHGRIGERREPRPGWYGNVLLIVAEEVSTDQGHLIALQTRPHRYRFGPQARQAIDDIADAGGWALVAHPAHASQSWSGGWGGTSGLEIGNLAAAWSRHSGLSAALAVVTSVVDRDAAALRLLEGGLDGLRLWDSLTALSSAGRRAPRPRVAIGAADAHGPIVAPVPIPSYADTLAVLSTIIWIDVAPAAAAELPAAVVEDKLLAALRHGRAALEVTAAGDAGAFGFRALSSRGAATAAMGDLAAWEAGPWRLRVDFASEGPYEIVVFRDGEVAATTDRAPFELDVELPGTYRVEIFRADLDSGNGPERTPWLAGNPVYLWPASARSAAHARRVPPLPPPPLSQDLMREAVFEAEDEGAVDNVVVASSPGVDWHFALLPGGSPEGFVAMAWRPVAPLDWSGAEGVVVRLDAESPFRAELQVRTLGAGGADEIWSYSVKAGSADPAADPAVAVPWHRFRSTGADAGAAVGSPGLSGDALQRVTGVFLVVTPTMLEPGSNVVATLATLGLFGGSP